MIRRSPRRGSRRAVPLGRQGQWRKVSREAVWALEEHDGELWQLQGVSNDPASAARFALLRR